MLESPTTRTYASLDRAYDHFNRKLFGNQLPPCLITTQRHKGAYGYFSGDRFACIDKPEDITDEIALNPAGIAGRTSMQTMSTLVHEMVHLWQHHFGKTSRAGYHNREWSAKMHEVGLIPTDTGDLGGKETGQKVTHIIEDGGRFQKACDEWLTSHAAFLYHDRAGDGETRKNKAASMTKYSCPSCDLNAWAKPDAFLVCGDCGEPMEVEPTDQDDD